jgi:hypothetical protein
MIRALDALEVGDQRLACAILLSALGEDDCDSGSDRCRCWVCGQGFEWPGLLDAHVFRVHPDELDSKAA